MSYGTAMGLTLPTIDGVATEAQAAPLINTALAAIIARLESKVTPAGMSMSADLSMRPAGTSYGITNLMRAGFRSTASAISASAYPSALYVVNGDLYFNDANSNQIRVTSGGAVNVSATGGITGSGYGASSVEVNWDAVNTRYKMRSGAAADAFASVYLNDVQFNDGSGNSITLGAPAIASDYSLALPTAQSGSNNSVVQVSTAGAMSITGTPTLDSLTTAASGDITAGAGGHFIVSSTGSYKHGNIIRYYSPFALHAVDSEWVRVAPASGGYLQSAVVGSAYLSITLCRGERLIGVNAIVQTDNVESISMRVDKHDDTGWLGQIGTTDTSLTGGGVVTDTLTAGALTEEINPTAYAGTGIFYTVTLTSSAFDADLRIYGVKVTYDRP